MKPRTLWTVLAVLGLALVAFTFARGPSSENDAFGYTTSHLQSRADSVAAITWYRSLDEALTNRRYRALGEIDRQVSDVVVKGRVIAVAPGAGFAVDGDDAPDGRRVAFNDKEALWRTVHLTVKVDQVLSGRFSAPTVAVGLAIDAQTDGGSIMSGLREVGDAIFFLKRSNVFRYDPSLYGVVSNGSLVATVGAGGNLALPFAGPDEAASLLAAGSDTLAELVSAGQQPEQVVPLQREGRALHRK